MTAYDDAARAYLTAGWSPIPVRGKSQPARGTTGYEGTVTAEKVERWLNVDLDQRARDGRGVGLDNIGLRHQLTLSIDVDQGYGNKGGVAALAAWAEKRGLPALTATWSSTARGDDSPSRQYLYRITEDVTFKTKPCDSVELCTWHHRFTVCAPTIHPGTHTPYVWYVPGDAGVPPSWGAPADRTPAPGDLAVLPAEWVAALRGGVANADRSIATVDLPALFASFPQGQPDKLVDWLIAKWADEGQHVGHDEFKNALLNCLMVGREGHPGVDQLYRVLVERYTRYLAVTRPDVADAEVRSLVNACATIAQQKPIRASTAVTAVDEGATDDEVAAFLATYTRYQRPDKLGRRTTWMHTDEPRRLAWHARCLVRDCIAGDFPADRVLAALTAAYRHHGGDDPRGGRTLLSMALGAILDLKVSA